MKRKVKMKKYFIATIVALTLATAGTLSFANEKSVEADLGIKTLTFGQIEGAYQYNNDHDFTTGGGTYAGVSVERELWGTNVFGTLSGELDEDIDISARDAFIGVGLGPVEFSIGRMPSIERNVADNTVNIFEGAYFEGDQSSGRVGNQAKTKFSLGGVSLVGTAEVDNDFDSLDSWGAGASYRIAGIGLVGAYAKDDVTGVSTILGGSTYTLKGVTIGGTFAQDETSAGVTTNTLSYVAQYSLGQNDLKGGYQNIEDGTNQYILEVAHNLDENASVYVNGVHNDDNILTVGFRLSF